VKEFQAYYRLPVSGIADDRTLEKIAEVLNPPYSNGDRGVHIVSLKKDLTALGFGNFPSNPSISYGSVTANVVKEFQQFVKLKADGVADEETLKLLAQIKNAEIKDGYKGNEVVVVKQYLTKLGFGNFPENPSSSYGSVTKKVVMEFQSYYGIPATGELDIRTMNKMKVNVQAPYQHGSKGTQVVRLKKKFNEIQFGNFPRNPSDSYGSVTEQVVRDFQRAHNLVENGIVDEVTMNKIDEVIKGRVYTKYNLTLKEALEIQMKANPQTDKKYAYVSKEYIKNGVVTANKLNVRREPNTSKSPLGSLSKGTKVDIDGENGNFYAIKYNSSAWVTAIEK